MGKLNIAIADDNERMVNLLETLINDDNDLELVGQADNGKDIYDIIKDREPDVVLLDIIMPKVDGLTVMEKVNQDNSIKKLSCIYCDFRSRSGNNYRKCV